MLRRFPNTALVRHCTISAGFLFILTACSVGPNFREPAAPNVSGYDPAPISATASSPFASGVRQNFANGKDIPGDWWSLFHCPALNRLIIVALKNNPNLDAAQASLREARENVYAQEGNFFPSISGNGQAERLKEPFNSTLPGFSNAFNIFNASVNVSYILDVFGGNRRQVESLIAEDQYQGYELEASYLSLTSNVVTGAINEASLREQIQATQEIVKSYAEQLKIVQSKFELGGASKADVLLQETTLRQEQALLPPLQLQLAQQINALKDYAGQFPSEPELEKFRLDDLHLPTDLPVSLPSQLTAQRPDIRASAALLHQASANIGVAVANRLPQISLSGSLGSEALKATSLFTPGLGLWTLAGNLVQPIFEGGTLLHKEKAADAAFDQAAAQYRSTVLTGFEDVANTLKALQYDADTLRTTGEEQQSAQASLDISRTQYKLGATTYIELLTSEQNYQTAKINFIKARATRFADTAALYQALGGGWWHRQDVKDQPSFIENPL